MGYYRSSGGDHERKGVVLPDWAQTSPDLASAVAAGTVYEIPDERSREAIVAGAIMAVGEDPAVVVVGQEAKEPVPVG